jgi:O-antigen/teichoic acid export membrane protein
MMALFAKGYSLFFVSLFEVGTPFVRMMILSRALSLRELGFASALGATYAGFEQITDFAIYRFVFSARREKYQEALASAHALSVLRGLVVGGLAVAASPFIAMALSLSDYWLDFALLGGVIMIRSLEHLAPRVAERDYRYGVQFKVNVVANGLALTALVGTLLFERTHVALLASLFAQMIGVVAASHALADTPYRLNFRSPLFVEAFRFGYPLMFNGMGLAASSQGDRFIVGAFLGLPALGIYAVATLATLVPMIMVGRLTGTVMLAALYNATRLADGVYEARVRLAARLVPLFCAVFALGVLTLMNVVVPAVFGRQFLLSRDAVALLAAGCFFRMTRGDPFTSMLMHTGRTHLLALANLSSASSLLFQLGFVLVYGSFESVLAGRLLGEITALAVILYVTRREFRSALRDWTLTMAYELTVLAGAAVLSFTTSVGERALTSLMALASCAILCALPVARLAPPLFRVAFPNQKLSWGLPKSMGDGAAVAPTVGDPNPPSPLA